MRPRHSAEITPTRSGARRLFGRRDAIELAGVSVDRPDRFKRLSPSTDADSEGLFRLAVLPLRFAALAVLWATSSRGRALFAAGAVVAAFLIL